jgi:hypothetical protein
VPRIGAYINASAAPMHAPAHAPAANDDQDVNDSVEEVDQDGMSEGEEDDEPIELAGSDGL